jgi:putative ABC transport system substrate-binding protein
VATSQQPAKIPRIGYLIGSPLSGSSDRIDQFRQGLHELGYVEGKNIIIERRSADGNLGRLPTLAAELVRLKVDIIVTAGPGPAHAAKEATTTIPIVMTQSPDPVAEGLVASLARPGGNITGLSTLAPELSGKRLEILKETIPGLSRVAIFSTSAQPGITEVLKGIEVAAGALKVTLQYLDVLAPKDVQTAFRAASKGRAQAGLMQIAGAVANTHWTEMRELAVKIRLPMMYPTPIQVEAGGLMSYGIDFRDLDRRAATFVDKILKGRKPADLPVEQPMKFQFIVNLKAAKQIGLTIPPNVLVRADKVIK